MSRSDFIREMPKVELHVHLEGSIRPSTLPERFADAFAVAREAGVHSLPHAGEVDGPKSVWGAIRSLGAERIRHKAALEQEFKAGCSAKYCWPVNWFFDSVQLLCYTWWTLAGQHLQEGGHPIHREGAEWES